MDEDDFDFDSAPKSKVKKGRRARSKNPEKEKTSVPPVDTSPQDEELFNEESAPPPRPSRRQMGWDMMNTSSDDIFDSRLQQDDDNASESGSEIPVIPDLEELHEDEFHQEIAAPPTVAANNMATFRELDEDLMNQSTFRMLDGVIDMKLLIKNLPPEKEVREEKDEVWDWDKVFAQIASAVKARKSEADSKPVQNDEQQLN